MSKEPQLLQILFMQLKNSITAFSSKHAELTTDLQEVTHACDLLDEFLKPQGQSDDSTQSLPEMKLADAYRILGRDKPPPIPRGHAGPSKEMLVYAEKQDLLKIARLERVCTVGKAMDQ